MKKTVILLGACVLSITVLPSGLAGQQLGDNATLIVPTGTIKNARQVLVVKSAPKATASKVGDCESGEVHWQDADLVDRALPPGRDGRGTVAPPLPTVATQVAIIVPGTAGFKEYKVGFHLGKLGDKGKCGPGYDVYLAHIIAIE